MPERVWKWTFYLLIGLCLASAALLACGPAPTPTLPPTDTPLPTATATETSLPTATSSATTTSSPTITFTPSATSSPTASSTSTYTPTPTPPPLADWIKEGDLLTRRGQFIIAEARYKKALAADPAYVPAHVGLSWLYSWQVGREEEALAHAQKAVELAPQNVAAQAALAWAQIGVEAPDKAVAAAEQAAKLDGKSALAQVALARACLFDRQMEAAQRAIEAALALDAERADVCYVLGLIHWNTGDFPRAVAAFERAAQRDPHFAPWQTVLGAVLADMNRYEQATAALQRALELAPDYVRALLQLAVLKSKQHDYAGAEKLLQRATELAPNAPEVYVEWGYFYLDQGEDEKALGQFGRALEKRPSNSYAQAGLISAYLRQEECESAARQAEQLIATHPRFAVGRYLMGYAKLCAGEVAKALEYLRKAVELEPNAAAAHEGLGHAYVEQERWEEALASYMQALRFSGADANYHSSLGGLFYKRDEADRAKEEYKLALCLDPHAVQAHTGLSTLFLDEGRYAEAQAHAQHALALEETNHMAELLLGVALFAQGEAKESAQVLEQFLQAKPELGFARYFLGLAYRDLGQYAKARKELEAYLALEPSGSLSARAEQHLQALKEGYVLDEATALAKMKEIAQFVNERSEVAIEGIEGKGRTVIISLPFDPEREEQDMIYDIFFAMFGCGHIATRIEPPPENGILVQVKEVKRIRYSLQCDLATMKALWDGVLNEQQLFERITFVKHIKGEERASVQQIEENLSQTRELVAKSKIPYQILAEADWQERLADMDAETQEALRADEVALKMLGLLEPEADLLQLMTEVRREQVAGFYDPEDKAFYLPKREEETTLDESIIAHEIAHALQDQHFDLESLEGADLDGDRRWALRALIEGDAMLAMSLYTAEYIAMVDQFQALLHASGLKSEALEKSPAFLQEMQMFPYREGLSFVNMLYERGKWAEVNKAYKNPPQSTEQILHPERYWAGDKPEVVSLPLLTKTLGAEWRQLADDVMGELGWRLILAEYAGPAAASLAAEGWGGDRYVVLQRDTDGARLLVMRVCWDNEQEAEEFWTLYQLYMLHRPDYAEKVEQLWGPVQSHWWLGQAGHIYAERRGRCMDIVLGTDKEAIEQVIASLSQ